MNKICTDINQTKKLIELGLDIDSADLTVLDLPIQNGDRFKFIQNKLPGDMFPSITDGKSEKIPAWSLTALLELMPDVINLNGINYRQQEFKTKDSFCYCYADERFPVSFQGQPVDAAFEMVCWLKQNNKI